MEDGSFPRNKVLNKIVLVQIATSIEFLFNNIPDGSSLIHHPILQEAPLTLRRQRGRCRNIKGEPQIYESFPSPGPRPRFLLCVIL